MYASAPAARSKTRARGAVATSVLVVLVFALLVAVLAYFANRTSEKEAVRQYRYRLVQTAELRGKAIEYWLSERWGDAATLQGALSLAGESLQTKRLLAELAYLERMRVALGYSGISVTAGDGLEIATAGETFPDSEAVREAVRQAAQGERRVMLGPQRFGAGTGLRLAFVVPSRELEAAARVSEDVIVLYWDPRHVLYSLLEDPLSSFSSSESVLIRTQGNTVVHLSPLRRGTEGASPPVALHRRDLPAMLALKGRHGVAEGVDRRGVPVLYAYAPISGTDWRILVKIDRAEALAPLTRSTQIIAAWAVLLITLAALAVFWLERRRQFADVLFQQKAALERAALEEHFRQLAPYARDPTFLYDADGRILEANERAVSIYGYPHSALLGKRIAELRAPDSLESLARDKREIEKRGELMFESVHQRADGSTFPVEISARYFEVDGRGFFHAVAHDISARKSTEARIQSLNRLYQTLWQTNEALVRSNSLDEVMRETCRVAVDEGGLVGAWISMVEKGSGKVRPVAMSRGLETYLANADISTDANDPRGRGPIGTAIREGRTVIIEDFMHDPALEPWRAAARELRVATSAAFPLRVEDEIVGTLSYNSAIPGFFDAEIVQLFEQTARDVGFAMGRFAENDRRLEAERKLLDSEEQFKQAFESASIGIVLIGTDGRTVKVNRSICAITGYPAAELVGEPFQKFLAPKSVEPLLKLFAQMLSGEREAVRTEGQIVRKDGRTVWIRANAARVCDSLGKLRHLVVQVEDISEYKTSGNRVREYMAQLEETMTGTIRAVSTMVEIRDPYTAGHELRVGKLAAAIADEMGLDAERCRGLDIAGSLHDIGKISVPAEILSKPTRLQPAEYEIVKMHAQSGYDILKDIRFPWPIAEVARQHHERLDGSGYPQGLKGEQIILEARILAVADVVESMGSHRPYRPARGLDAALEEIANGRGQLFDADAVDACLRLFGDKGYQLPA